MTLVAAWGAWLAVQKQIAGQKTIADGQKTIADRHGALHRFMILQQQLQTVENDLRQTGIVKRRGKKLQQAYKELQQAYFAGPSVHRLQVNDARKELEAKIQNLENLELDFTFASTSRSALPESIKTRKDVIAKLGNLKSAVEAARQALAAIPPKGTDEISAQDLAINIENEVFDALPRLAQRTTPSSALRFGALKALSGKNEKKRLAYESELPSRPSDTWFILDHTKQTGQPIDLSPTGPAHIDQVSLMDVKRRVQFLRPRANANGIAAEKANAVDLNLTGEAIRLMETIGSAPVL
jgi:hypothetical protein